MPPSQKFDAEATTAAVKPDLEERQAELAARLKEARQLYSNDDGEPILRPSITAYLDALGTKASLGAMDNTQLRESISVLDRFRWFLHDEQWSLDQQKQRFLSFSDNVILGVPYDPETDDVSELSFIASSAAAYQLNMTIYGHVLRGGLAHGPLYMDDRYVTGQALVDAVLLEEHTAIYPRVVLSKYLVDLAIVIIAAEHAELQFEHPLNHYLLVDADGLVFLNYLPVVAEDGVEEQVEDGLTFHRDLVHERLKEFEKAERVREKYRWVADYHNHICREWFGRDDLCVTSGLTPVEEAYPRQFRRLVDVN